MLTPKEQEQFRLIQEELAKDPRFSKAPRKHRFTYKALGLLMLVGGIVLFSYSVAVVNVYITLPSMLLAIFALPLIFVPAKYLNKAFGRKNEMETFSKTSTKSSLPLHKRLVEKAEERFEKRRRGDQGR